MVGYSGSTGKYQATIKILGKLIFLGEYKTFEEAKTAEKAASLEADDLLSVRLNKACISS